MKLINRIKSNTFNQSNKSHQSKSIQSNQIKSNEIKPNQSINQSIKSKQSKSINQSIASINQSINAWFAISTFRKFLFPTSLSSLAWSYRYECFAVPPSVPNRKPSQIGIRCFRAKKSRFS